MLLTKKKFQKLLNNNNQSMRKFKKKKNKKPSDSAHTQRRYPKYMTRHNLSVKRRGLVKRYPDKVGGATKGGATKGGATKGGAGWFGSDKEEDMFNQIEKDLKKLVSVNENLTKFKDKIVEEIGDYQPPEPETRSIDNTAYDTEKGRLDKVKGENATKKNDLDTKTMELKQQHESAKEAADKAKEERQNAITIARKQEEQKRLEAEIAATTKGNVLLEHNIQSTKDETIADAAADAAKAKEAAREAAKAEVSEEEVSEEVKQCATDLGEKATSEPEPANGAATATVPVSAQPITAEKLEELQC